MSWRIWPWLILVLTASPTIVPAAEIGLITGNEKGTYVMPSKGSIENIYAVYQRPATQLGIVQADVLAFVSRVQSDPVLRGIAKKTKMVFPLYNAIKQVLGD